MLAFLRHLVAQLDEEQPGWPAETVLYRGLGWTVAPASLPGSILPCNLQYLVTPTLKFPS